VLKKRIVRILITVVLILLVPVFGTLFIDGWNVSASEFLFIAALLLIASFAADLATAKIAKPIYRVIVNTVIVLALLLIWTRIVN
jgi:hypothetical protein